MKLTEDELRLIHLALCLALPLTGNPMRKRITPLQIKVNTMIEESMWRGAIESAASDHSGLSKKGQ